MTWSDAWGTLNSSGVLEERPQQRTLAEAVFAVTDNGGTLVGEAGTGTGKSFAYLVPLIWRVRSKERSVVSTETTALQDQLVDKDLPLLKEKFGGFTYRSLKGRSHYLCLNRAPQHHGIVVRLQSRLGALGNGERRDVERVLGYRLDDADWEVLSGDADFCAQNACKPDRCSSSRARKLALEADIVVCNHAVLRTHAEMEDGLLGDFKHLVVDEAHTLEKVLVDGWGEELTPYDRHKSMKSVWDGLDAAYLSDQAPRAEEAEKLMLDAFKSAVVLHKLILHKQLDRAVDEYSWQRHGFLLSEQYLAGAWSQGVVTALEEYELQGPGRLAAAAATFEDIEKKLTASLDVVDSGKRKVRKGATAARRLSRVCGIVSEALQTRDGIVVKYGVPYAVIGDGWKAWKGDFDVRIRCVPLDVSRRTKEDLWDGLRSVTLVSATLSDAAPGDFSYTLKSLGLEDASPLQVVTVNSPFDYAKQQLLYLTPEKETEVDVPGARFSLNELERILRATQGRALVLFTARAELDYAADVLQRRGLPHQVLIQEKVSNKQILVEEFKRDTSSVLLATKSFFTGVDFPGETCSVVVLAKYPLPQYNALCRAQIAWWRKRGFANWYDREGTLVARQAVGRLIRTERDHGVIALLDQRPGMHDKIVSACAGSYVTQDVEDIKRWLHTKGSH